MRSLTRPIVAAGLAASLLFGAAACGSDSDDAATSDGTTTLPTADQSEGALAEMAGKRIGVQAGTTGEIFANENTPEGAEVVSFGDTADLFGALASGDIDGILQDLPVNAGRVAEDPSVQVVATFPTEEQYGFAVAKGSELVAELNTALAAVREDGTYDLLYDKYFPQGGAEAGPGPEASDVEGTETIKVCSDIPYPPMEFEGEGPRGLAYTGFDIDLLDAMAVTMDAKLEVIDSDFDGILGNLAAGTCDVVASSVTINDERKQEVDFTDAYFDADQSLLVPVS